MAVAVPPPRIPAEITLSQLSRAAGIERRRLRRRLDESRVVMRRKGRGTRRKHVFVTWPDLEENASWLVAAIRRWDAIFARYMTPEQIARHVIDERDDDDEDGVATRGSDGVYR